MYMGEMHDDSSSGYSQAGAKTIAIGVHRNGGYTAGPQ